MFVYNYLELFTIKMLILFTAFTKLIAIFHPGDGKSYLVYLVIRASRTPHYHLNLVDYLD